ncbi:cyclin-like protein [Auriculariales sp. MPI-PUGE-AT-0066]|nr:cyclin-like protein [Auriculariales sp. MPI-PUGE-AT-0066]
MTSDQWLFTLDDLERTPSSDDGMDVQEQLAERAKAIEFMFRVGLTLKLTMTPLSTAATYFHRFFMRRAHRDFPYRETAIACLFLAAKIEETARKVTDTAQMAMAKAKNLPTSEASFDNDQARAEVELWVKNILTYEEAVVSVLCFDLVVDHPQTVLEDLIQNWQQHGANVVDESRLEHLQGFAWTLLNDSFRTPLCILVPHDIVAVSCFIIAAQAIGACLLDEFLAQSPGATSASASACRLLGVGPDRTHLVHVSLRVFRDWYASQPSSVGRFAYLDPLSSLPIPTDARVPLFPKITADTIDDSGSPADLDELGSQSPQADGNRTPGGIWSSYGM